MVVIRNERLAMLMREKGFAALLHGLKRLIALVNRCSPLTVVLRYESLAFGKLMTVDVPFRIYSLYLLLHSPHILPSLTNTFQSPS